MGANFARIGGEKQQGQLFEGIFLVKLLLPVHTKRFIEALYRLAQQTIPSFGSTYGQTPGWRVAYEEA